MHLINFAQVLLLLMVFVFSQLNASAQRPPTSGPNPGKETNLVPIIIAGGGLAVGAGSYFYLRQRGPKIAIQAHLPGYLLSRNILPTQDALNLMYELNPRLEKKEIMRSNQKLIDPEFPTIPEKFQNAVSLSVPITGDKYVSLMEKTDGFRSFTTSFRSTEFPNMYSNQVNQIQIELNEIEKFINSTIGMGFESNSVMIQTLNDLFEVLNLTLERTIQSKRIREEESKIIIDISEEIRGLLSPPEPIAGEGEKDHFVQKMNKAEMVLYASLNEGRERSKDIDISLNDWLNEPNNIQSLNMQQGFAFAVYKLNPDGDPITQGPEVEGKYIIKYIIPALKNHKEYYQVMPDLATYASEFFPPAKYHFMVEDLQGKEMKLVNSEIDFRIAFNNPQRKKVDDLIIVILRIPND